MKISAVKRLLFLAISTAQFLLIIPSAFAHSNSNDSVDYELRKRLEFFGVKPFYIDDLDKSEEYLAKIKLGKKLFIDKNLSGNRNISCSTCHDPKLGTSDAQPLSQSEDGLGILRRNSSSLYNIGKNNFMFWDGRVFLNPATRIFTTPEDSLNGATPSAFKITQVLKSALSAQAIFPLLSQAEMRGRTGENEIADASTNLQAWERLVERITKEGDSLLYKDLFQRAYGVHEKEINIGHVGEAIGSFISKEFQSAGSPFHRYLNGENAAMSADQKKGLAIFIGKGKCISCHSSNLLGNDNFFASVGIPTYGSKPAMPDRGRGDVTKVEQRNFFFKTPSLINISLTAPYMHNGIFKSIREVIIHYNQIRSTLEHFELTPERKREFPVDVEIIRSPEVVDEIWKSIQAPFLRKGLGLSLDEMNDLEVFLSEALTEKPKLFKPGPI
ncbi:MAG: hypothetical protein KBD76_14955 [Bacteriovorax sp.]|nr:hypothetical protein [Bacteriovorax sp.]